MANITISLITLCVWYLHLNFCASTPKLDRGLQCTLVTVDDAEFLDANENALLHGGDLVILM